MIFIQINNIMYLEHLQEVNLAGGQDLLSDLEEGLASGELSPEDVQNILQDYTRKSK